jgi:hypothetical protein
VVLEHLFDSNVREYEGDVEVNKNILSTFEADDDKADFWWLNNGITIVADLISGHTKELVLKEPRIVNGLQTSTQIGQYFKDHPQITKTKRHVAIKLIQSDETDMQDRIIKAANSQTRIPAQYLWATEELQRDIEQIFRASGLHYARRKNSWKKSGTSIDKVVGMTELAQSVAAVHLQQPDHARARPSRYFKQESYKTAFSPKYPPDLYVVCALVKKRTEAFLKKHEPSRADRTNLLFYVAMAVVCIYLKTPRAMVKSIAGLDTSSISESAFATALSMVRPIYERCSHAASTRSTSYSGDVAAKGTDMVKELKDELVAKFRRIPKRGR